MLHLIVIALKDDRPISGVGLKDGVSGLVLATVTSQFLFIVLRLLLELIDRLNFFDSAQVLAFHVVHRALKIIVIIH